MRRKLISLFICSIFLLTMFSSLVAAGDEDDPEIRDHIADVRLFGFLPLIIQSYFKHTDIVSIWFHEDFNDSSILYVSLKLRDLKLNTGDLEAIYVVHWLHNDKMWEAVLKIHPDGIYGTPHVHRYFGHDDYSDFSSVECNLDTEKYCITWKIPKEKIGNPNAGDMLKDSWGFTNLRNTEESGKNRGDLFKDYTHNVRWTKEYLIQY